MRPSMATFVVLLILSFVMHIDSIESTRPVCGTRDPTEYEVRITADVMKRWNNTGKKGKKETVNIKTYWHTIKKKKEGAISDKVIQESINILNAAFSPHFSFTLVKSDTSTKSSYWGITPESEGPMKKALRKGNCAALNIYSTEVSQGLLGWATFPNSCSFDKVYDGVVIMYSTTPGGDLAPFNEGDTLTHEVGHWLGLYHTFEGGCKGSGDLVDDTPAVQKPNFGCKKGTDSCPNKTGKDMINNFMDYTDDDCMDTFTNGQYERMMAMWNEYRSDGSPPTPTPPTPNPPSANPPSCKPSQKPFEVEVKTDRYGQDITFYLQKKKSGNKKGYLKKKILRTTNLSSEQKQIFGTCVLKKKCYRFTIVDEFGDGLCCSWGDGWYRLYLNGKQILYSTFENKSKETKKFGC